VRTHPRAPAARVGLTPSSRAEGRIQAASPAAAWILLIVLLATPHWSSLLQGHSRLSSPSPVICRTALQCRRRIN
jgi:hypothetical protein